MALLLLLLLLLAAAHVTARERKEGMPPPRGGSPASLRITRDVVMNALLWFGVPLGLYGVLVATSPSKRELERELERTPEGRRNRERREKLVDVIKPDKAKDEELRALLNKGMPRASRPVQDADAGKPSTGASQP